MLTYLGILFTLILGVLLHFTYAWSGRNVWVAFIAPTNESLFEHLKLLFTPYLLWTLVEYAHYGQFMGSFIPAKVLSLYFGMALIVLLFYAYTAITKKSILWLDISIFVVAVLMTFAVGEYLMTLPFLSYSGVEIFFDAVLIFTVILFMVFTIYPPNHEFFKSKARRK